MTDPAVPARLEQCSRCSAFVEPAPEASGLQIDVMGLAVAMNTAQVTATEIRLGRDLTVPARRIAEAYNKARTPEPQGEADFRRRMETCTCEYRGGIVTVVHEDCPYHRPPDATRTPLKWWVLADIAHKRNESTLNSLRVPCRCGRSVRAVNWENHMRRQSNGPHGSALAATEASPAQSTDDIPYLDLPPAEAEAALAALAALAATEAPGLPLDVETLATAMDNIGMGPSHEFNLVMTRAIATEYARLRATASDRP